MFSFLGPPVHYSEGNLSVDIPPPQLGEHTDAVLAKYLAYKTPDIEKLREKHIIQ